MLSNFSLIQHVIEQKNSEGKEHILKGGIPSAVFENVVNELR